MRHENAIAAGRAAQPLAPENLDEQALQAGGLRWRGPWWYWQGLACLLSSLSAPTFAGIGALLVRDAHSDHPAFWAALMCIVPLVNLLTAITVNQVHHRRPFATRKHIALVYGVTATAAGAALFMLAGWATHFLGDFVVPMDRDGTGTVAVCASLLLSLAYGAVSFAHAAVVHAWMAFGHGDEGSDGMRQRAGRSS